MKVIDLKTEFNEITQAKMTVRYKNVVSQLGNSGERLTRRIQKRMAYQAHQ